MKETENDVFNVFVPFDLEKADYLLRTLAHPIRYRMTELMLQAERTAVDFQEIIGINEGAAMQHLRVLKQAGIAETRRRAQTFYYFSRSTEGSCSPHLHGTNRSSVAWFSWVTRIKRGSLISGEALQK